MKLSELYVIIIHQISHGYLVVWLYGMVTLVELFYAEVSLIIIWSTKMYVSTKPLHHEQDKARSQFLSRVLLVLNLEFSFFRIGCHTKAKEPRLPHYLPIARRRTNGFMLFPRALAQREMETALSKIWSQVTHSIFLWW